MTLRTSLAMMIEGGLLLFICLTLSFSFLLVYFIFCSVVFLLLILRSFLYGLYNSMTFPFLFLFLSSGTVSN